MFQKNYTPISERIFLHHKSFEPNENFALEEFLLKESDQDYCLIYQNKPSLILGHFQCLFREVNLEKVKKNNIAIYRRISGGGCVYHDEGNLNVSIIGYGFEAEKNLLWMKDFLEKDFSKKVEIGPRNELFLEGKKISGSAYKKIKERSLHHFTLLCQADLKRLNSLLKGEKIESLGTQSKHSLVSNLDISIQDILFFFKKNFFFENIPNYPKKKYNEYKDLFLRVPYKREVFYKNDFIKYDCIQEKINIQEGPQALKDFMNGFSFEKKPPKDLSHLLKEVFYYS